MELINKERSWYFSDEAKAQFEKLPSLADRTTFLYSYLKTIAVPELEKDNFLFKMAFLLADAVYHSTFAFAKYPLLITVDENPFINYISNLKAYYSHEIQRALLLLVIQGRVEPNNTEEWIYDVNLFQQDGFAEKLNTIVEGIRGSEYMEQEGRMSDPDYFELPEDRRFIQLEILWLFGKQVSNQ